MENESKREAAKCLKCGHEWYASGYGIIAKPSRCPNCKSRKVKWKHNCTEKQKNAHMPEDLADETVKEIPQEPEITPEEPANMEQTEQIMEQNEPKVVKNLPEEKPETVKESPPQPKKETRVTVKSMAQKKEHPEKRVRKTPVKKPMEEIDDMENPEEYFNPFDEFIANKNDAAWKEAKANAPKINPAGIILLLGAAAAVAAVVFFLRKNPGFFAGKIHQAPIRKAVQTSGNTAQTQARLRPATLDAPRLGGML